MVVIEDFIKLDYKKKRDGTSIMRMNIGNLSIKTNNRRMFKNSIKIALQNKYAFIGKKGRTLKKISKIN